jgi:hypothetical protein
VSILRRRIGLPKSFADPDFLTVALCSNPGSSILA